MDTNAWYQQVQAAMQNGAPQPQQPLMLGGQPVFNPQAPPPPPPVVNVNALPNAPPSPHEDPARGMSVMPAAGMSQAPPTPQAPARDPQTVDFRRVMGGGMVPAREMATRGPQANAALMHGYGVREGAQENIGERSMEQAGREEGVYRAEAMEAVKRIEVADQVVAQRRAEMQELHNDYRSTIDHLAQMKVDRGRVWNNMSTGEKIGTGVLVFLAGLGGGNNIVLQTLMRNIDEDVAAQEFSYKSGLDRAKNQQTAFAMAMDRYQSEDAARAAARAAALDYTHAMVNAEQARWKGVDAQNRAEELKANIVGEKETTIANGLKFMPAGIAPARYQMSVRGQVIPGLVSEDKAQSIALEHSVKPAEKIDEELVKGGIQSQIKAQELAGKKHEKTDEGARNISQQLQTAGVPQARAAAERALATLNKSEGGRVESNLRDMTPDTVGNMFASHDANAREQAYWAFKNAAMKAIAGNVTAGEEKRLEKQFGEAADPESRKRAIKDAMATLDSVEKNAKAGASPEAQEEFERRRLNAEGAPPAAPAAAKKGGW